MGGIVAAMARQSDPDTISTASMSCRVSLYRNAVTHRSPELAGKRPTRVDTLPDSLTLKALHKSRRDIRC